MRNTHRRKVSSDPVLCQPDLYSDAAEQPLCAAGGQGELELLLVVLCTEFEPQRLNEMPEDERRRSAIRRLLTYVEEHYAEKLTLENLADFAQYNRTYVSTLFKQVVGVNFHEYLSRVRFQHA